MFYFTSSRVRRGVPYGSKPRNRLDIYVPDNAAQARPVVIYVTGGHAPFLRCDPSALPLLCVM